MKRIYIAIAALATLVFAACNEKATVIVRLDETAFELVKGSTRQLKATVLPADDKASFEWFSSMPEYVSVSETGMVKAEKLYYKNPADTDVTPVSIYCKCNGGAAECKVTVTPLAVKSIAFEGIDTGSNEYVTLPFVDDAGTTDKDERTRVLKVTFEPENADVDFSRLEWKTSNFEIVSVDPVSDTNTAVITAKSFGSATVTATYASAFTVAVDVDSVNK